MFDEKNGSTNVSKDHIKKWVEYFASTPRFAGLMTTNKVNEHNKVVKTLAEALKVLTYDVKVIDHKRDKREPEFNFYDLHQTTMNVYKVKPAVFDLILSLGIAGYLFLVYGLIVKSSIMYGYMANFINGYVKASATTNFTKSGMSANNGSAYVPGSPKLNGHNINGSNGATKLK